MHAGKISLIVVCSIVAIAAFAFVYANRQRKEQTKTNQETQYLIEARKNIIGVWETEDVPGFLVEYRSDGTMIKKYPGSSEEIERFKIINTTPVCGEDVDVDLSKQTMYIQETDDDNDDFCQRIYFITDKQLVVGPLGMFSHKRTAYRKR